MPRACAPHPAAARARPRPGRCDKVVSLGRSRSALPRGGEQPCVVETSSKHCAACSVWAPSPPAACAPPHRERSCSLVCTSPEPPTTTRRRLPTAYAPGSVLRFGGAAREPLRCARHRGPWTGGTQAGLRAPPAQRDARPADGRRQAPICAGRIDRADRQLAEHPGLAVPGRCLNRPVDGAPGPRRTQAVLMPEPELDPG